MLGDGIEWVVDAVGCEPAALRDPARLAALFDRIVHELDLRPVQAPSWHVFPDAAGVTGLCMLSESHLTVHTFPEHGSLCLNLFCCRARAEWPFAERLAEHVGAREVRVRRLERRYAAAASMAAAAPAVAGVAGVAG